MIINIEGGDASGKQTQTKILAERIGGTRFAFPNYESPTGKLILAHLKNEWSAGGFTRAVKDSFELNALIFQSLMTINRFEILPIIQEAHKKGPILFDRFSTSALVYGALDGLSIPWIERINDSLPKPDLNILLDVPVDEGFKRRPERRDRIESNKGYLEKVRIAYLKLFSEKQSIRTKSGMGPSWITIDGTGAVEEVSDKIWQVVKP